MNFVWIVLDEDSLESAHSLIGEVEYHYLEYETENLLFYPACEIYFIILALGLLIMNNKACQWTRIHLYKSP